MVSKTCSTTKHGSFAMFCVSQEVYFRATQLGLESLARVARQTAEHIPLGDQLEGYSAQFACAYIRITYGRHFCMVCV